MTHPTGNNHPRVIATIDQAKQLVGDDQVSEAIELLSTLSTEFPKASSLHGYLAWFLLQIEQYQDAIEHSREAVRLSPKSERVSLVHFHVLWKTGLHIEALDEMKRFLIIQPSEDYLSIIQDWDPV